MIDSIYPIIRYDFMKKRKKYMLIAASWFTVLLCWQFFSLYIGNKDIFPSAFQLIAAVFYLFSEASFLSAVSSTLLRGICGMSLSLCLAGVLAWCASRSDAFRTYIHPFLTLLRSVPIISFLFLFLIWFSPEYIPLVMALITIVPVLTENLIAGFRNIDRSLLEMSYMYTFSVKQKIKHIIYPAVSPYLFSGLISTAGLGWKAIIMGEALAQPVTGIGVMIREAHGFIEVPRLLAWTLVAVVISYGFELLLKRAEKYSFPVSFASKDYAEKIMENFPDILNIDGIQNIGQDTNGILDIAGLGTEQLPAQMGNAPKEDIVNQEDQQGAGNACTEVHNPLEQPILDAPGKGTSLFHWLCTLLFDDEV